MDVEQFRKYGKQMVDYMCEYRKTVISKRVVPNVEPGYLQKLLPYEAPQEPEDWDKIMQDVDNAIMPGLTHWQHPRFHAYFPNGNSFPAILGDMLSDAIGCLGYSWIACPACTELEAIAMDWLGKAIGLPDAFISSKSDTGGGVLQPSASDGITYCMMAARNQAIASLKTPNDTRDDASFIPKLVAYTSAQAHSCVEKAAKILLLKIRLLEPDENCRLRGETLRRAIQEDKCKGLIPFFVAATLGTTGSAAFDNLTEIGQVCENECCMWFHIDAAYAGCAFICPELRHLLKGVEYADSIDTNPYKCMLVSLDCSCLWLKNKIKLTQALASDPLYLKHTNTYIDYRHWGIPLSRRFRSLKLWCVMKKYGISGLQNYHRNHIKLAKEFEKLIRQDCRFEVANDVILGLVCFRIKNASDKIHQTLLANLNDSGKIHMVPAMIKGKYIIRFCVVHENSTIENINYAYNLISDYTTDLLQNGDKPRLSKEQTERLSFTRTVSNEDYNKSNEKLADGATPILITENENENK